MYFIFVTLTITNTAGLSFYPRFIISPENDINFGFLMLSAKKIRTITIENKGEFEFKYSLAKMVRDKDLSSKIKRV